jgi:hypothetical protein
MAHRGERVGGLARLRDEQGGAVRRQRRIAVAVLRGDVEIDRQARELLEPVFGDHAGVVRRAAGDHGEARDVG